MKALTLTFALVFVTGCSAPAASFSCTRSADCDTGICVSGSCVASAPSSRTRAGAVTPFGSSDAGTPSDTRLTGDANRVATSGPCANSVAPTPDAIVLNEVLANPPSGLDGDANGDGIRDPYDDEFVELVNRSDAPVDMTGVRILNGGHLKFTFEPFCLLPHESVVVFGGGQVTEAVSGNATVSDVHFGFPNSGGTVTITAPSGTLASMTYSGSPAASLTLDPQITGTRYVSHLTLSPLPFSPGRCADGRDITTGCKAQPPPPTADAGAGD